MDLDYDDYVPQKLDALDIDPSVMQLEAEGFHNSAVLVAEFELCFPSMAGKNSEREELWAKRRDQIFGRPWDRGTEFWWQLQV